MSISRRDFMKDTAATGTVIALGAGISEAHAGDEPEPAKDRCPFFDQPLMCGGKRPDGTYPCDN